MTTTGTTVDNLGSASGRGVVVNANHREFIVNLIFVGTTEGDER